MSSASVLKDYHDLLALYLFAPSPVFNRTSASMADLGDSSLTLVRPSPKIKQETQSPRVRDGRKAEDDSSNRRVVSRYFVKTEEEKKTVKVGGSSEAGDKQLKGEYSEAEARTRESETETTEEPVEAGSEADSQRQPGPSGSRAATKTSNRRQKRKSETAYEEVYTDSAQEVVTDTEPAVTNPGAKKKKKRTKRGYAPPEVYAHLNFVQDCIGYGLDILFCGINPGQKSAGSGHHFAGPTNGFWKCLHQGGLTDRLVLPSEDHILPEKFKLGITNLVDRPSAEMGELSKEERRAGVPVFLRKVHKWRPKIVCMVGKGIWEDVFEYVVKMSRGKAVGDGIHVKEQVWLVYDNEKGAGQTLFFVVPSTSGRVLTHQASRVRN
ncbi:Uracil DNA glycosylase superfamily [Ceratobasidium sp. AG-Ba]|nr:Uracil DNA glycosylase superfamily [Ceratobasidium sp. AG-Ba]